MPNKETQFRFVNSGNVQFLEFAGNEFDGVRHGFFTRIGGISSKPFGSLNLGGGLGDLVENINENRKRVFSALGRPLESMYDVWQVHSTDIVFTDHPRPANSEHQKADAIFTDNPEVTLLMRFADCVPIMIYHPGKKVVGIIHAGWKGTVHQIVTHAIQKACQRYNITPDGMIALIGPSIGPDHYEVGTEVYQTGRSSFPDKGKEIFKFVGNQVFMDLWNANRILLRNAGVITIFSAMVCTACNTDLWFSHRAENGQTGRFAAVIGLE